MTDPIREIEGKWEEIRARDAELVGLRVRLTILYGQEPDADTSFEGRTPTARELRRLPPAERARYLEDAETIAAPLYEADLARPPHERELTAFTALDGEAFHDDSA